MIRAARKDSNHKEIVGYFRLNGFCVLDIAQLKNCCDLFVSKNGRTVAIEIKDGSKPPSQRKLTKGELKFMQDWKGEFCIIESKEDVDNLINTKEEK